MSDENPHYTKYELARWSVLVRERDCGICYLCKRQTLKRREIREILAQDPKLQGKIGAGYLHDGEWLHEDEVHGLLGEAHHIRAKYHYPHLALQLDNGVTLCWRCHRQVVHSTYDTFRIHVYPFRMYTLRDKWAKEFNAGNQVRVYSRRRRAAI